MTTYTQDPDARLDYTEPYTAWLAGDTIVTSEWIASDVKLILEDDEFTTTSSLVWVRFDGAVDGDVFTATNRITTASGRMNDRTVKFKVKEQ